MALVAQPDLIPVWRQIRAELRRAVGEAKYEIWLAPLEVKAWEGDLILVQAPAPTEAWVARHYGSILETCAKRVAGAAIRVAFAHLEGERVTARGPHSRPRSDPTCTFNPRYTFQQFIIGDGNQLAHGASLAVAELPGLAYNPLFLHAPPGLGKTHLLHAIGNYITACGDGATVRYTTVEEFTNHFITSLGSRSLDRFKAAYRDADVLLIDDVQFLASKAKTEEEFFHTFNSLYEAGRQLVLTCDRLPRQLVAVEERLRERFESGLVADIQPPDYASRLAILRKRAELDHIALADSAVLELIAERVTTNIRALEGALIRVVAYHSLTQRPIDVQLARTVLDRMYPETQPTAGSITDIQALIARRHHLSVEELISPSRVARIAWPRQMAIYLARDLTDASLHALGEAFGGRSHATIVHACNRVSERLRDDPSASEEMAELAELMHKARIDRPS